MTTFYSIPVAAHVKQPDGSLGQAVTVLAGADMDACEAIGKLPHRALKTDAVATRDGGRHRWFFKLISTVHKNLPDGVYMTAEELRSELLIAAGHSVTYTNWRGETKQEAKSIAWSNMDETAFGALVDQVIHVICQEIIPGFSTEDAEMAVLEVMG